MLYSSNASTFQSNLLFPYKLAPARPGKSTITGTRRDAGRAADELSAITRDIESAGYEVGYMMLDINTGITVSYNADKAFYSASSIKGPYVVSLVEYELGSSYASESTRIANILEYSDNDAYTSLRGAYGNSCFATLAEASGATAMATTSATENVATSSQGLTSDITDEYYEFVSANQMVALWRACYTYLTSNSEGAAWLGELLETPEDSAIRYTASTLGTTWSKAGWYPGEDSGFGTAVDAGIVRTSSGDVVICVMTTDPEDFGTLESIVGPLLTVRGTLCN